MLELQHSVMLLVRSTAFVLNDLNKQLMAESLFSYSALKLSISLQFRHFPECCFYLEKLLHSVFFSTHNTEDL